MKRSDRSLLTNWWFQIDWSVMGLVVIFSFIGLMAGIYSIHLLSKILMFYGLAGLVLLFVPMLTRKTIIKMSVVLALVCLVLFVLTYISPTEINESKRWVRMFGFSIMPADLMKPAFITLTAWFITKIKSSSNDFIGDKMLWKTGWWPTYLALFFIVIFAMFFHPDLGNMFMYLIILGAMLFWAGAAGRYIAVFGVLGALAVAVSFIHPHFRARILGMSDSYQVNRSLDAIRNGGLWGRGDESFLFDKVPMANNDFIFSSIAEMWGAIASAVLLIMMFWMFVVLFRKAIENKDEFSGLVIFGSAMLFFLHVAMNVLTALGLFMKGTTLPFISYGGSSLIAFSLVFGIVLSLIRQDKWGQK